MARLHAPLPALSASDLSIVLHPAAAVYLLLGPVLALLLTFGLLSARVRMNKLLRYRPHLPEPAPSVAVCIPARNESGNIRHCLESVLAMRYPQPFRVVAVDDRSTDDTLDQMRALAVQESRLTVLAVTEKPDDWLGKTNALRLATQHPAARDADYILFVDSDVLVSHSALELTVGYARARGVDALSVLTRQRCVTFWEKLMTPLACGVIVTMYTGSLTNNDHHRRIAFANGQFFLIRRSCYDTVGGHEPVKLYANEDVDLARHIKSWQDRAGAYPFRVRLLAGNHVAETRFYTSLSSMLKGWARIYSSVGHRRPGRIVLSAVVLMLMLSSVLAAPLMPLLTDSVLLRAAAWVHLGSVLFNVGAFYAWSGNSPAWALLFPLAAPMQFVFFAKAIVWCFTNRIEWRGATYATAR